MSYWYMATPYARFEGGHQAAAEQACLNAAILLKAGIPVFSPIAHSHAIAETGELNKVDHDFWLNIDRPMMEAAQGLIFVEMKGWQNSKGMHEEIVEFTKAGKPVVFMTPGVVPEELLPEMSDGAIYAAVSKRMVYGDVLNDRNLDLEDAQASLAFEEAERARLVDEAVDRCTPPPKEICISCGLFKEICSYFSCPQR